MIKVYREVGIRLQMQGESSTPAPPISHTIVEEVNQQGKGEEGVGGY